MRRAVVDAVLGAVEWFALADILYYCLTREERTLHDDVWDALNRWARHRNAVQETREMIRNLPERPSE